jgi:hypothetical protein
MIMAIFIRLLPACLVVLGTQIGTAWGQDVTTAFPEVTTDTRQYCERLRREIGCLIRNATIPLESRVLELSAEGQRMCEKGLTRGGIYRLRRAMVILRQDMAAP